MDRDELENNDYEPKFDIKGAFTGTLPSDPPLLRELGVDFITIRKESNLIFKIFTSTEVDYTFIKNADVTGPLIFIILYSTFLLLNCKIHFGYVYFFSLFSLISTFCLLNVINTDSVKMLECCSILGYSFSPIVVFSFLNIFMNKIPVLYKLLIGLFCAVWSSYTASLVFVKYLNVDRKQFVVGYPLFITYVCFSMIVIF